MQTSHSQQLRSGSNTGLWCFEVAARLPVPLYMNSPAFQPAKQLKNGSIKVRLGKLKSCCRNRTLSVGSWVGGEWKSKLNVGGVREGLTCSFPISNCHCVSLSLWFVQCELKRVCSTELSFVPRSVCSGALFRIVLSKQWPATSVWCCISWCFPHQLRPFKLNVIRKLAYCGVFLLRGIIQERI